MVLAFLNINNLLNPLYFYRGFSYEPIIFKSGGKMSTEYYTLLGVVIGGVIALSSTLINIIYQRNQERIKLQKEIYESRFKILEEHLEEYYNELPEKVRITPDKDRNIFSLLAKKTIDRKKLINLYITEDYSILDSIRSLIESESYLLDVTSRMTYDRHDTITMKMIEDAVDDLMKAYSNLILAIDRFRLNEYKPPKKTFWKFPTKIKKTFD